MSQRGDGRRERHRRSRRLIVLVVVIELIGIGALAVALTSSATSSPRPRAAAMTTGAISPTRLVAHPQNPLADTTSSETTAPATATATVRAAAPRPRVKTGTPGELVAGAHAAAAEAAALSSGGVQVSVAIAAAHGPLIAGYNPDVPSFGASVTKALLLLAAARAAGDTPISGSLANTLAGMIQASDNADANTVFKALPNGSSDVQAAADAAGMTSFQLDTSDPVYVLGQSRVTAADLAGLFARFRQLLPVPQRSLAMQLLATPSADQQDGLRLAGLPEPLYSKEGWKPEPSGMPGAPYVVTQAVRFPYAGQPFGIAVTVQGTVDKPAGDALAQQVGQTLAAHLHTG